MENKRYWLFICEDYYPYGGIEDLKSTHDTVEEAILTGKAYKGDDHEWHVVDSTTLKVVAWYSSRTWRMTEPYKTGELTIEEYKNKIL